MKHRLLSLLLCFLFLVQLNGSVFADGADLAAQRQEDLDVLYQTLKEAHPNLFANTPEHVFLEKKAQLAKQAAARDDYAFLLDLQSLVALAGDSHTSVNFNISSSLHVYPFGIEYYEDRPVLLLAHRDDQALLGQQVVAINNIALGDVLDKFRSIISYDNEIKLRRQFKQLVYIAEILEYLGVCAPGETLTLTTADGQGNESKIELSPVGIEEEASLDADYISLPEICAKAPVTFRSREQYYFAQPLDESSYYIQYNRCAEDKELPMADFCAQVQKDLDAGAYRQIMIDMRYNGGGSDGVLVPLIELLRETIKGTDIKLFCLIGEGTFSSAINNTMMLKEIGAITAGEPTSGSVDHYGSLGGFTLPNSGIRVSHSTKLIKISDFLESGYGYGIETLTPDVSVPQTLEDSRAGVDTTVTYLRVSGGQLTKPVNDQAPLTRGAFAALLWSKAQASGSGAESGPLTFGDVFPFAPNTPAVAWACAAGVANGLNQEQFAPAHVITREEAAVMLLRFSQYLGKSPAFVQRPAPTDAAQLSSWAKDAALTVWGWQGFIQGAEFLPRETYTLRQGKELVDTLFDQ